MTRQTITETGVQVDVVTGKIIHLIFNTQKEMCKSMMRFNAYYESPKFKKRLFTIGEFKIWYCSHFGVFDFYRVTEGFNIPSSALEPFYQGLFNPLSRQEKSVLEMFNGRIDDFYVISTYKGCDSTIFTHESLHGLYGTIPEYKEEVDVVIKKHNVSSITNWLKEQGYDCSVINDEINAYIVADFNWLAQNNVYFPLDLQNNLVEIKNRYLP